MHNRLQTRYAARQVIWPKDPLRPVKVALHVRLFAWALRRGLETVAEFVPADEPILLHETWTRVIAEHYASTWEPYYINVRIEEGGRKVFRIVADRAKGGGDV